MRFPVIMTGDVYAHAPVDLSCQNASLKSSSTSQAGTEPTTCAVDATHVLCPSFYLFSFTYLGTDKVGSFREAEP